MYVSRTRRRRGNEECVVTPFRLGTLDKDPSAIVHEINGGQLRRRIRRDYAFHLFGQVDLHLSLN